MTSRSSIWACIALAEVAIGGCHRHGPPPIDPATADLRFRAEQPLPATRQTVEPILTSTIDRPVAEGALPLVYLVGTGGTVRIADMDAKRDLATATVQHNETIAVDSRRGVIVGGQVVSPGPLPAAHEYGIYISSDYTTPGSGGGGGAEGGNGGGSFRNATETNRPSILDWRNPATREAMENARRQAAVIKQQQNKSAGNQSAPIQQTVDQSPANQSPSDLPTKAPSTQDGSRP